MKRLALLATLLILGCAPSNVKHDTQPTPFVVGKQKVTVVGCVDLHKEVKEWNENNPDKEPRIADC